MLTRRQQRKQQQAQQQVQMASFGPDAWLPDHVVSKILDAAVVGMSIPRDDTADDMRKLQAEMAISRSRDLAALLLVCRKWRQQVEVHSAFLRFKRLELLFGISVTNDWLHLVRMGRSKDYKRRKLPVSIQLDYPHHQPPAPPQLPSQPHTSAHPGQPPAPAPGPVRHQVLVLSKRSAAELASFPRSALVVQMNLTCPAVQAAAAAGPEPELEAVGRRHPSGAVGGASSVMQPQVGCVARPEPMGSGGAGSAASDPGIEWQQLRMLLKAACADLVLLDTQYSAGLVLKVVMSFTGDSALDPSCGTGGGGAGGSRQQQGDQETGAAARARPYELSCQVREAVQRLARELTSAHLAVERGPEEPAAGSLSRAASGGSCTAVLYLIPTVSRFTRRVPFRAAGP